MNSLLTFFAAAVLPLLAIALTVMAHRHVMQKWRAKIDTELAQALSTLGVTTYTLLVDKLTSPSTDRTAQVYRILLGERGDYYLFMNIGEQPGLLKPLSKERALLAVRVNG
ncbi:hypothetical protein F477_03562 [Pseudomonas sp. URIL14HWK12:I3]|uniref:hypothetical protein n=1 Tax=Pseudomonas TaxID=286 RepID=UPI000DAEC3CE|nr:MULTISPECIES: hypothetical protein [Pseudomonas]MDH0618822.1 hypothetical protein [Pseudomonas fulva]PZW52716.1 hypothetical protein F478_02511 [Pseudomonas sp. URIL14HWK12:I2]PZW53461.1 hypothetical protein F477_03562 [Pseudomonas sp. URIL14HWK12:I3]